MKLSLNGLKQLCENNLVELKFRKRTQAAGKINNHRRMLCTLDPTILDSQLGIEILNFKKPTMSPPYSASSKNLLTVWDIFMQNWRNIPIESVDVISTVPTKPAENFWKYFDKVIRKMSPRQKINFINK